MATARDNVRRERPDASEHAAFYAKYVAKVADGDIVETLRAQQAAALARWTKVSEAQGAHRYAPDKWSVRQVIGHLTDAERIFVYRATRFARGDATPVPGFEENDYVANAAFDDRTLASLVNEWRTVRESTIAFFDGLNATEWTRRGTANHNEVSVRALAWITAGHAWHHDAILQERYAS
jgi:uncharacterized damage-inducible protein DinB